MALLSLVVFEWRFLYILEFSCTYQGLGASTKCPLFQSICEIQGFYKCSPYQLVHSLSIDEFTIWFQLTCSTTATFTSLDRVGNHHNILLKESTPPEHNLALLTDVDCAENVFTNSLRAFSRLLMATSNFEYELYKVFFDQTTTAIYSTGRVFLRLSS